MKAIKASQISVGMTILGQKINTLNTVNLFKVKHVQYSKCGKFVYWKADKISPVYETLDILFSSNINKTVSIL